MDLHLLTEHEGHQPFVNQLALLRANACNTNRHQSSSGTNLCRLEARGRFPHQDMSQVLML